MTSTALRADAVAVELDGRVIVEGIDLEVGAGQWVTLIGPNGAGKTTLLRALAGLVAVSRGEISVLSPQPESDHLVALTSLSLRERARVIAYVPQQPVVPSGLSVSQYVLLGRSPHMGFLSMERPVDHDVVARVLDALELVDFASRRVDELSGGEWQRVVMARALAQQPRILLLDEPTTSLDIGRQQDVLELVDDLRADGQMAIISTMHELTLAGQFADRLVLISGGKVAATGRASDVLTDELLAAHYGARLQVVRQGDAISLLPLRERRD